MENTNRRHLSSVYVDVQNRIDLLVDELKITPQELSIYSKNNTDELMDILGLVPDNTKRRVCLDVVEHLSNAEVDNIFKFESFSKFM